jgi:NAD(P)-dependent dehydrogenase (short-subunit alcohol dehydrogenase family)
MGAPEGETTVVTGGTRGIGLAAAKQPATARLVDSSSVALGRSDKRLIAAPI